MTDNASAGVAAAPVAKANRIDSLDILRGIAVFGILLMNISAFGMIWQAYGNPNASGGATGFNLRLFEIMNVGFEGTMRGLFSMLFGAGIVLMTERMEAAGAGLRTAEIHFRRMSWMMLFGFIHWALLLWAGEILFAYSMCGFLLFAVRKVAAKWQLVAGVALLVTAGLWTNFEHDGTAALAEEAAQIETFKAGGGTLSEEQEATLGEWTELRSHSIPTEESTAMFTAWHTGSYPEAVAGQFGFSREFQWNEAPFWLFFDMIPFMLIGMALLKWQVLTAERPAQFYAVMMLAGYGIGIPLGLYELGLLTAGDYGPVAATEANRTYQISRLAMVVGHLGLVLMAIRGGVLRWLQRGLAAAGQMALSNYIGQTLICTVLFYGFGFGLYNQLDRAQLYLIVLAIAAFEMAFSLVWLRTFRFGPLEWVWRSLTYWKRQPMRLHPASEATPALA